ncbi:MAG TPA: SRPBCC family protein [Streptosporangiaceae bacterium]
MSESPMAIELDNSFTVPVPPDVAWAVLLDVARIAPCMPGATVDEVDGDVVNGRIKVKVGPVSLTYKGTATFTERNEEARKVSVEASGKETRGAGTASAVVTASLSPAEDDGTVVTMHTTMNVTGRPAQFGRGVMAEVSGKLVEKFAENLAVQLTGNGGAPGTAESTGEAAGSTGEAAESTGEAAGTSGDAAEAGSVSASGAGASGANGGGAGGGGSAANNGTGAATSLGTGVAAADSGGAAAGDSAAGGAPVPAAAPSTPPAPAQDDSLNLVRLVAPAILKRVLPVAAIAAAVALLGRRIRRTLRNGRQ